MGNRLIPDIIRSFEAQNPVIIRNPGSTRPWQHVLEPLSGYLLLAENLFEQTDKFADGWNFGPDDSEVKPVQWVVEKMVEFWPGSSWRLDEEETPHEAKNLKLDISKARAFLGWAPTWSLSKTLEKISLWHLGFREGRDMQAECIGEIEDFIEDMLHAD